MPGCAQSVPFAVFSPWQSLSIPLSCLLPVSSVLPFRPVLLAPLRAEDPLSSALPAALRSGLAAFVPLPPQAPSGSGAGGGGQPGRRGLSSRPHVPGLRVRVSPRVGDSFPHHTRSCSIVNRGSSATLLPVPDPALKSSGPFLLALAPALPAAQPLDCQVANRPGSVLGDSGGLSEWGCPAGPPSWQNLEKGWEEDWRGGAWSEMPSRYPGQK